EGSELVSAGKINDGLGILFSGKAQILLPDGGGELLPVAEIEPGDHFGEIGALLDKPSPYFVIATESSRALWMLAQTAHGMIASGPQVGEAVSRRLAERMLELAAVEKPSMPEVMTDIEAQLLQVVEAAQETPPASSAPHAPNGVIPFAELRDFDLSPTVLTM